MKALIAFVLFASLTMKLQAQNNNERVQKVVIDFFEALSAMKPELIDPLITKDFVLLETGEVWNADSLKKRMILPKGIKFQRTNKLDFIKIETQNNVGWICYHNKAEVSWNNSVHLLNWLESAVLVKENDVWKISLLHSTKVEMKVEAGKQ